MWFVPLTNPMSSVSSKSIDPGVRIGHVHLKVANLERAIGFYHGVLGFDVVLQYGGEAAFLSAGGYHHHIGLNTWESAGGAAPPAGTTGLYHVAILYPTRAELADALTRLMQAKISTGWRFGSRSKRSALPAGPGRQWRRTLLGSTI
jgi:catechol 2,3-dioxygenase